MANTKQTSKSVASKASSILRDGRYSAKSKSVAGRALSQTKTSSKNPKEGFGMMEHLVRNNQEKCFLKCVIVNSN